MSIFQDSDRNDKHPVLVAVRILPYARKNHQERSLVMSIMPLSLSRLIASAIEEST